MYRKILGCLHTNNVDESRKARFAVAFQAFKELEDVLVKPEEVKPSAPLPKTLGELLAMRKKH